MIPPESPLTGLVELPSRGSSLTISSFDVGASSTILTAVRLRDNVGRMTAGESELKLELVSAGEADVPLLLVCGIMLRCEGCGRGGGSDRGRLV